MTAKRPILFGLTTILIATLLSATVFIKTRIEDRPGELFSSIKSTPQKVPRATTRKALKLPRFQTIIVRVRNENDNLLQRELLSQFFTVFDYLASVPKSQGGKSYRNMCLKLSANSTCIETHLGLFWGSNRAKMLQDNNIPHTLAFDLNDPDTFLRVSAPSLLGGVVWNDLHTRIVSAKSTIIYLYMEGSGESASWERSFVESMKKITEHPIIVGPKGNTFNFSHVTVFFQSELSVSEEILSSIIEIGPTLAIGVTITLAYIVISFLMFKRGDQTSYLTKLVLGIVGMYLVVCSIISSISLASFFGIPVTPFTIQGLPLFLLGCGVDSLFTMQSYFQEASSDDEFLSISWKAMGTSCITISLSMLTIFLTDNWSILCVSAVVQISFAITLNFLFMYFGFSSFCILEREVCILWNRKAGLEHIPQREMCPNTGEVWLRVYGWLEGKPLIQKIVLLLYVGLIFGAILSMILFSVDQKFEVTDIYPTNSYLFQFFQLHNKDFGGFKPFGLISIKSTPQESIDFSNEKVREWLRNFTTSLEQENHMVNEAFPDFYSLFMSWLVFRSPYAMEYYQLGRRIPSDKFQRWFSEFAMGPAKILDGLLFTSQKVRGNVTGIISANIVYINHPLLNSDDAIKMHQQIRKFVADRLNPSLNITLATISATNAADYVFELFRVGPKSTSTQVVVVFLIIFGIFLFSFYPNIQLVGLSMIMSSGMFILVVALSSLCKISLHIISLQNFILVIAWFTEYLSHQMKVLSYVEFSIPKMMRILGIPFINSIASSFFSILALFFVPIKMLWKYFFLLFTLAMAVFVLHLYIVPIAWMLFFKSPKKQEAESAVEMEDDLKIPVPE